MSKKKPAVGDQFGRWSVIGRTDERKWHCRCSCGTERDVDVSNLMQGRSTSCGCFKSENMSRIFSTHRMVNTPTYMSWAAMIQRCCNPQSNAFWEYGGRGITVCDRWRTFENFFADMGERPKGTTLDRIDGAPEYGPGVCRWATPTEQVRNRSVTRRLTYGGETRPMAEWAEMRNISYDVIKRRLQLGWTIAEALGFQPKARTHPAATK